MPHPDKRDRFVDTNALDRGLSSKPEEAILTLLRVRFLARDDPNRAYLLQHRRIQLVEQFNRIEAWKAARIRGRLVKLQETDELSKLFWKLATETRDQMLRILEGKISAYRQVQSNTATQFNQIPKDPTKNPRYIDNLCEQVFIDQNTNTVDLRWEENGNGRWVTVDLQDFYGGRVDSPFTFQRLFPDRASANREIQSFISALSSQPPPNNRGIIIPVGIYRGRHNTFLPTLFTNASTPKIMSLLARDNIDIDAWKANAGSQNMINMLQAIFHNINHPFPVTIDQQGNIQMTTNPTDVLKPLRFGGKRGQSLGRRNLLRRIKDRITGGKWLQRGKLRINHGAYRFKKRWIKGRHNAQDYEEGFNALVPKMAREVSDKKVRVDVPSNTGYRTPSSPSTNRLKYQKSRRGKPLVRRPDATMEIVEETTQGGKVVAEVHFWEATTETNFRSGIGRAGHKQRQTTGTLWISSEIGRKGYMPNTRLYYHIVAPDGPTQETINFLNQVMKDLPNVEIQWFIVQ